MPDFSVILQSDTIRSLVQDGVLERSFYDALYPELLFRKEAIQVEFPGGIGDSLVFSGVGLIRPKPRPLAPGVDPAPSTYTYEQWSATVQQYADSIDTHIPTSVMAIANLLLRDAHQLGMSAGQTLNRTSRDRLYNAALSGHTMAIDPAGGTAAQAMTTTSGTLHVASINGFDLARRPDLTGGSAVRFADVSAANPLKIMVLTATGALACLVVGVTPDTTGDDKGPGTLSLTYATGTYSVVHRSYVLSDDSTFLQRVGGGNTIDALTAGTDIVTLADIRAVVAKMRKNNVPTHSDGTFHCHIDPTGESQLFEDTEFQNLLRGLPDNAMYKEFAIGTLLGVNFYRNNECPTMDTVERPLDVYTTDEPFAGQLLNDADAVVNRALFTGAGCAYEYYVDQAGYVTEAGISGKIADPAISNAGIQVDVDKVKLIIRAPQNRLQDLVSTSYRFVGDWPTRTDVATGDDSRYKRTSVIEFSE